MSNSNFAKSDIGAQAAWKGFSSQTLYIAYRLLMDDNEYELNFISSDSSRLFKLSQAKTVFVYLNYF